MLFSAVLLDLGIDVLHEGVPLHQHVREGGAREDPHHLCKRSGEPAYIEEGLRHKKMQRSTLFVWGKEFIQFLAALVVLPRTILNNGTNCTRMLGRIHPILKNRPGKECNKLFSQTEATTFAFSSVFNFYQSSIGASFKEEK